MKYSAATAFVVSALGAATAWGHPVTAASTSLAHLAQHLLLVALVAAPAVGWWLVRRRRANVKVNRD